MPEDEEELRKKLEAMSPDELKDFQKKQCIFCHISSGKVNARKVYEDPKVLAVLDINPANPGHILLLPKEHYMVMPQLPEDELKHIFVVCKQLSNVMLKALDVRGINILVANGPAAGQRAQHFMVHLIPRKEGDGLPFAIPSKQYAEDELEATAVKIRKKLNEIFGVKEERSAAELIRKKPVKEAEFTEKRSAVEKAPEKGVKKAKRSKAKEPVDLDAIARALNG